MIDCPSTEFAPARVFNNCINRLPIDPPDGLCKLSLCRKLLNASTNCVTAAIVEKLSWLAAASLKMSLSNNNDAESNCPRPEISTMSTLLVAIVAGGLNKKETG